MERTEKQKMEDRMEKRAREIARERGMPEALWEMCLTDAYMEQFDKETDDLVKCAGCDSTPVSECCYPGGYPDEE